jgi:putative transposase
MRSNASFLKTDSIRSRKRGCRGRRFCRLNAGEETLFPSIAAKEARYLIHDRDPLFARSFREPLKSSRVKTVKLPARSPNLNAYAERFVRSIKSECLAQIIPLGEQHLRRAVNEYTQHYHVERNHQGLDNRLIEERNSAVHMNSAIERRERLGWVLSYYERRAA